MKWELKIYKHTSRMSFQPNCQQLPKQASSWVHSTITKHLRNQQPNPHELIDNLINCICTVDRHCVVVFERIRSVLNDLNRQEHKSVTWFGAELSYTHHVTSVSFIFNQITKKNVHEWHTPFLKVLTFQIHEENKKNRHKYWA